MPQSTTTINAKALSVTVSGQDICGTTTQVDLTVERLTAEFFTACGDYPVVLVGKRRWSGTLNFAYSETANEAHDVIVTAFDAGTAAAVVFSPAGGNTGDLQWSGNVLFTSMPYSFNPGDANAIMLSVPFLGTGDLTRAAAS